MSAPTIGWIGLGNMGRGMVKNLITKSNPTNPIVLYNRTTSRAENLCKELGHSVVAKSVNEVVKRADIIFICLGDDDAVLDTVKALVASEDTKDLSGKLLVDCSTIHPDSTSQEDELLRQHGATFVACPVFGAPAMAEAGQLVMVLAGPKGEIEKVLPFCKGVMGRETIVYEDADPSRALLLKVLGNTMVLNMVLSLAETHTAAEKTGLGTRELHKFIEAVFPGPYTAYSNRCLSGDYWNRDEPLFAVDLARKDARHARALAKKAGVELKGLEIADGYLAGVQTHMGAKGDMAGVYGAKRKEAGLKFENDPK